MSCESGRPPLKYKCNMHHTCEILFTWSLSLGMDKLVPQHWTLVLQAPFVCVNVCRWNNQHSVSRYSVLQSSAGDDSGSTVQQPVQLLCSCLVAEVSRAVAKVAVRTLFQSFPPTKWTTQEYSGTPARGAWNIDRKVHLQLKNTERAVACAALRSAFQNMDPEKEVFLSSEQTYRSRDKHQVPREIPREFAGYHAGVCGISCGSLRDLLREFAGFPAGFIGISRGTKSSPATPIFETACRHAAAAALADSPAAPDHVAFWRANHSVQTGTRPPAGPRIQRVESDAPPHRNTA
ncbi:hypothetical protein Bbelb_052910 [Branchiostoma belcheri]|nr:hypothetical protein Bbelb_052910 [Branchiostoma belcheri]